jgi:hypothetical protein
MNLKEARERKQATPTHCGWWSHVHTPKTN